MLKKHLPLYVVVVALFLILAASAWGQNANGRIIGTVADPQGAVVPDAQVKVTNVDTGVATDTITNEQGYFEVLSLPIGRYHVSAEHQGFKLTVTQDKTLEINQTLRFDIKLVLGASSETVTVEAQVSGVETVNSTLGETVSGSAILNMPLNGRDVLDLALLQPGVTDSNAGATAGSGFSIAGARPEMVNYFVDGGLNNDLLSNNVVFNPNPDSIAEFRILESNYSAEYGRNAGGVVSVVTKSGTNQLHGTAYDYFRNDFMDANLYFDKQANPIIPKSRLQRNQFGGTLGGPISIPHLISGKDRFFFFVSYQGQRENLGETDANQATFTTSELSGDFSHAVPDGQSPPGGGAVCQNASGCADSNVAAFLSKNPAFIAPGTIAAQAMINPSMFNPAAKNYIGLGLIPATPTGLISTAGTQTNNNNELTGKLDFNITNKDRLTLTTGGQRFHVLDPYSSANNAFTASVPEFPSLSTTDTYFGTIAYLHTFSANLLNDLRFTAQRNHVVDFVPQKNLPAPQQLGFNINPDTAPHPPFLQFDTGLSLGFADFNGPSKFADTTYALSEAVTWVRGRSTWKFGGGWSPFQDNLAYGYIPDGYFNFNSLSSPATGNSYADFLIGAPAYYEQGPLSPNNVRTTAYYVYGQDEWRARDNLVLTLGLRYDYSTPQIDTKGRTDSYFLGAQSTVRYPDAPVGLLFPGDPGAPRGMSFPDRKNVGPRFGFAWDPWNDHKTSIRGGVGIFWDIQNAQTLVDLSGNPPYVSYEGFLPFPSVAPGQTSPLTYLSDPYGSTGTPDPFPSHPASPTTDWAAAGFLPWAGATASPHLRAPYIYQYNVSVQHELARNLKAEANYVGSDSKILPVNMPANPMLLGTTNRPFNLNQTNPDIISYCANQGSFLDPVLGYTTNPTSTCPFLGYPNTRVNEGFASYNSLQMSLTKQNGSTRYGNTFFTLGYTYGHSIDNASGRFNNFQGPPAYNIRQFRASSDYDVTHRIVFSGGWDLPFDQAWTSGPKRLVKGWTLLPIFSWRTGFPQTVNAGFTSEDFSHPGTSGAGDPGNTNAWWAPGFDSLHTENPRNNNYSNVYFNPATFSNAQYPAYGSTGYVSCNQQQPIAVSGIFPSEDCAETLPALRTYGLGRGIFRGPSRTNLDVALAKAIPIHESFNAQFRFEAFNVFNHTQFMDPNDNILQPTFGQVTSTYDPRILQIALRLMF